ncbi:MAG: hypothetical protein BHW60_07620 [Sutterella sp. 54_7]|nr:MAG: hypothetical protein BHW60_07620 [Sutterella sp. 54_7]
MAAFAVGRHAGTAGAVQVSTCAVAFFAAHALSDRVRTKLFAVAEGGKEFILALEVELPGVADFAVGRTRLASLTGGATSIYSLNFFLRLKTFWGVFSTF